MDSQNPWVWKKEAVYLALLLLALLVFFKDALLGSVTLIWDGADYFYPNLFYVSESLRQGQIPLWNPYLLNGFPIIANIEAQIFYPINLLFLPFTTFTPYAVYLSIILHFLIAGVSMYALARAFIDSRPAALMSAFTYMYSGFMIGHIEHVTIVAVMAWLPLVALLLERSLRQRNTSCAVLAGVFLGISFLAGHPQTSHAMVLFLVLFTLYRAISGYREEGLPLFSLKAMAVCLVMAAMIAAVQILPTYEVTTQSTRGVPVTFEVAAQSGQFSLQDMVSILIPNYFGALTHPYWGGPDISQGILYLGLIPALLTGLAFFSGRIRPSCAVFFAAMAIFSLLLALGANGPLFKWCYAFLPGLKFFRSPAHTVFLYTLSSAMLAGIGAETLMRGIKARTWFGYLGFFAVCCATIYLSSPAPTGEIAVTGTINIRYGLVAACIILVLATAIISAGLHSSKVARFALPLLLLVTYSDLYLHFADAVPVGLRESPRFHEQEPEAISAIKRYEGLSAGRGPSIELPGAELSRGLFRIYSKPEGVEGVGHFGFDRAMIFSTFLVEGFEPLDLSRHRKLISTLSPRNFHNLMKITNSRYLSTTDSTGYSVLPYANSLPRAYLVANARFIEDDDLALERLAQNDPGSEVIISGKGKDIASEPMAASEWNVRITKYSGSRISLDTKSQRDAFLVLSDTFYPNWKATIDGVATPVMRANYDFRAVSLPKGQHTVVFEYSPRMLPLGMGISLAAVGIAVTVLLVQRKRARGSSLECC